MGDRPAACLLDRAASPRLLLADAPGEIRGDRRRSLQAPSIAAAAASRSLSVGATGAARSLMPCPLAWKMSQLAGQHVLMEAIGPHDGPPPAAPDYSPRIIAGKPYSVSLLSRPHMIGALPTDISPCSTTSIPSDSLAVATPSRRPEERYLGTRLPQRLL